MSAIAWWLFHVHQHVPRDFFRLSVMFCGLSGTPDLDIEDGEGEVKMQDLKDLKGKLSTASHEHADDNDTERP